MIDNSHLPPIPPHADYTIAPASYVKNHYLVRCKSDGSGFKTAAMSMIGDDLNCRYVGRGNGYVASPAKVRRFVEMYAEYEAEREKVR